MTDRIKSLVVILDHDMRDDDVQGIVDAMLLIRGVASISRNVTDLDDYAARARVKSDIREAIFKLWKDLGE